MNKNLLALFFFCLLFFIACKSETKIILEKWDNGLSKKEKIWINKDTNSFKEIQYFETGEIRINEEFRDGEPYVFRAYYETGELSALFLSYKGNYVIGSEFFKNGQPMGNVPRTLDGKINGVATYYDEYGKILSQREYLNNVLKVE